MSIRFAVEFQGRWNQSGPTGAALGQMRVAQSAHALNDIYLAVGCQHGYIDVFAAVELIQHLTEAVNTCRPHIPAFGFRLTARSGTDAPDTTPSTAGDDAGKPAWYFPYATAIRGKGSEQFTILHNSTILTGPHKWRCWDIEVVPNNLTLPTITMPTTEIP